MEEGDPTGSASVRAAAHECDTGAAWARPGRSIVGDAPWTLRGRGRGGQASPQLPGWARRPRELYRQAAASTAMSTQWKIAPKALQVRLVGQYGGRARLSQPRSAGRPERVQYGLESGLFRRAPAPGSWARTEAMIDQRSHPARAIIQRLMSTTRSAARYADEGSCWAASGRKAPPSSVGTRRA